LFLFFSHLNTTLKPYSTLSHAQPLIHLKHSTAIIIIIIIIIITIAGTARDTIEAGACLSTSTAY
jgi:hypothetical protein